MSQSVSIDTTRAAEDSVAVIILLITMVLVTLVMVALIIAFVYKRQDNKKHEAVKQNLNNNEPLDSSRVPLNLDYNNLC